MGRLVERYWAPDWGRPGGRRARQGYTYYAYVPSAIADLELTLPGDLAAEMTEVEGRLRELQGGENLLGLESLSRQLLRAESIASSRIEGLELSHRRLVKALYDPDIRDDTARFVLGNIAAMESAIRLGTETPTFSITEVLEIHRQLLERTNLRSIAGQIRTEQNWLGGDASGPRNAEFIPPPEDEVEPLLEDLCYFIERDDLPTLAQAAITHAQFETIHPFADGNGRVGRALIHTLLRRRGVATSIVPPISIVLATNATRYVRGLTNFRADDVLEWCRFFTRVVASSVNHSQDLAQRLSTLQERWSIQAGHPRRGSAAAKLIRALPARPVLDIRNAAEIAQVSEEAARLAVHALAEATILQPTQLGRRRGQVWEAMEIVALLDNFEWDLTTPTRTEQPRRPAPRPRII